MPEYFQASASERQHDPATNWNLWGLCGDAWINYATAPTAEEAQRSGRLHPHIKTWMTCFGLLLPICMVTQQTFSVSLDEIQNNDVRIVEIPLA